MRKNRSLIICLVICILIAAVCFGYVRKYPLDSNSIQIKIYVEKTEKNNVEFVEKSPNSNQNVNYYLHESNEDLYLNEIEKGPFGRYRFVSMMAFKQDLIIKVLDGDEVLIAGRNLGNKAHEIHFELDGIEYSINDNFTDDLFIAFGNVESIGDACIDTSTIRIYDANGNDISSEYKY